MDDFNLVNEVMTHKEIPPGQMRLMKALYEVPQGLTLVELADSSDCSVAETRSTMGAFGNRVSRVREGLGSNPLRIVIRKYRDGNRLTRYELTEALRTFIDRRPALKAALVDAELELFFCTRHTHPRSYGMLKATAAR